MPSEIVSQLSDTVRQFLGEPQASLLAGILFGSNSRLPNEFYQALQATGTLHVVAVSGQNMSILAGFLGKLKFVTGWRLSLLVQGLGIIGYIYLLGGGASVIRSGLMALISLFAQATGRQADAGRALVVVALLMVLLDPSFLTSVGWQLSVLATAGIIWLEPLLAGKLVRLPRALASAVSVSLAAQAFTWPVIVANFETFSLIGLPANVLVGWSIPWIMALGSAVVAISFVFPLIGQILSWLVWVPLTYFVVVVKALSEIPLASFSFNYLPVGALLVYYTLLSGGIWRWSIRKA